jgi:hypothetical protein
LIQIKPAKVGRWHISGSNRSTLMTSGQFYYLLLVITSFTGFGLAIAVAYVRYRRWLATHPIRRV